MKISPAATLGITKAEHRILMVLAKGDALSLAKIASVAKVPRTTASYALKMLQSRGFVSSTGRLRRRWRMEDYETISSTNAAALEQLFSLATATIKTMSVGSTLITTYRGVTAIKMLWEKMTTMPKGSRLYGIQPDPSFQSAVRHILRGGPYEELLRINNNIKNNKIIVEALVHKRSVETISHLIAISGHDPAEFLAAFSGRTADTGELPYDKLDVPVELYLFGNTLALVYWPDEIALSIENEHIVSFFLENFKALKLLTQKYNQNERALAVLKSVSAEAAEKRKQ